MESIANKNITSETVADYFLALANETGDAITNLKLQKLVYYAQAWHLANFGKPLFDEDFEAWIHGPVIPKLYKLYKERGSQPIILNKKFDQVADLFDADTRKFLEKIVDVYFSETAYRLESMTHQEDPWIEARHGFAADENCSTIIKKDIMRDYYGKRISASSATTAGS